MPVFPASGCMAEMGHCKFQLGYRNCFIFTREKLSGNSSIFLLVFLNKNEEMFQRIKRR